LALAELWLVLAAGTAQCAGACVFVRVDLCEDDELKERISEIQREIEHSRLTKSRELSRRRSTNVIRRSVFVVTTVIYSHKDKKHARHRGSLLNNT